MPSDPFTFTPGNVHGVPSLQWRALRRKDGGFRIEWREMPDGEWREASPEFYRPEIGHGTEAGHWLMKMGVDKE